MLPVPMDVIQCCSFSGSEFRKFQNTVKAFAEDLEYPVMISGKDILLGNRDTARYVIAARCAEPSGVVALLEILRTMPQNQRNKVCFVLLGRGKHRWSSSWKYAQNLLAGGGQLLVLNLDSIACGDHIRMIPGKSLKKDRRRLTSLYRVCGYFGRKELLVHEKGIAWDCPENSGFSYGIRICTVKTVKTGIRKWKTQKHINEFDTTNINILRAALTTFICCDEVN